MGIRPRVIVPALLAALSAGTVAHAQIVDRRPALDVVLHDRAGTGAGELGTARARARFIFAAAGIRLAFVERDATALGRAGRHSINLVVAGGREADALIATDRRTLGFAIPLASRAYVHYDRVHALARSHGVQPGWFLGVVMAHELAHVLLPGGHSDAGVMVKTLSPDPSRVPAFTRDEARLLRESLGEGTLVAQR
jgi:hypothetical protein